MVREKLAILTKSKAKTLSRSFKLSTIVKLEPGKSHIIYIILYMSISRLFDRCSHLNPRTLWTGKAPVVVYLCRMFSSKSSKNGCVSIAKFIDAEDAAR